MRVALFLVGAAGIGFLAGGATTLASRSSASVAVAAPEQPAVQQAPAAKQSRAGVTTVSQCVAVDGDTLRCGNERIRLIGIDSPEMPGHCAEGRNCVEGDPEAALAALSGSVSAAMPIKRYGTDRYGRTLALVKGPLGDLSCSQLRAGHAIYRADWDVNGAMIKGCNGTAAQAIAKLQTAPNAEAPASL